MADERLVLPTPPKPEPIDRRPHPYRVRLDVLAIVVACVAALVSVLQWQAEDRQAVVAGKALDLAKQTAAGQILDVERSRIAAENSATAARILAETALKGLNLSERSARAAETSAAAGREALAVTRVTSKLDLEPEIRVSEDFESASPVMTLTNIGSVPAVFVTAEIFQIGIPRMTGVRPLRVLQREGGDFPSQYVPSIKPQTVAVIQLDKHVLGRRHVMGYSDAEAGEPRQPFYNDILQLTVRYHREVDSKQFQGCRFYFRTSEGKWVRENTSAFPKDFLNFLISMDWARPKPDFELHPFRRF